MEATAPIMVGLLVGSLILTCILSACAARVFKRRNQKKREKNEADLEYAAEKQRYYGYKRTKSDYVQYPGINTYVDSVRPMRLPESSVSSNDSSSRYIIPYPDLQPLPNNAKKTKKKQQISAISGTKNDAYIPKSRPTIKNKDQQRSKSTSKTTENNAKLKTRSYLTSTPPTRAVVY